MAIRLGGAMASRPTLGRLVQAGNRLEHAVADATGGPAQDAVPVRTDHGRELDQRSQARSRRPAARALEIGRRAPGRLGPEVVERQPETVGATGVRIGAGDHPSSVTRATSSCLPKMLSLALGWDLSLIHI